MTSRFSFAFASPSHERHPAEMNGARRIFMCNPFNPSCINRTGIIALILIVTFYSHIWASHGEITVETLTESWISTEDFATMVEMSFPFARCCNIYISNQIHEVETLFNQFRRIYPRDYLVKQKIYDCQGYFLLGSTVQEIVEALLKVPVTISTTEILVLIDNDIQSDDEIFNVSLYGNANVNVVTRLGKWSLSENYLEPRHFERVFNFTHLEHKSGIVDFKGRQLHVATFYRPPVCYLQKTVKRTLNGETFEIFLADTDRERDGIEMKLFLLMAEKLNFTFTLIKPGGGLRYGRKYNHTHWRGGVIQLQHEKKVDMSFGGIWLTHDQMKFVNLTVPWYEIFIQFLVPRPRPTSSFWALTRPFSIEAWICLIVAVLANTIYLYIRSWLDPTAPIRFRRFIITLTELIGRLLGTWIPKDVTNARLAMHLWHAAGLVIVTAYCSSLAARLASSDYEDRIDTVKQFLEANLTWGKTGDAPSFKDYFGSEGPYADQLQRQYVHLANKNDSSEHTKSGKFAIFGVTVESIFFPEDEVSSGDLTRYRLMKQVVGKYYSSFAVQPWLLSPVNKIILWLQQSGLIFFHLHDVIRRRADYNLYQVVIEKDNNDDGARVLELTPLGAGFSMLIIGLFISTVVFYFELRSVADRRSIRKDLVKIPRERKTFEMLESQTLRPRNFIGRYLLCYGRKGH